MTDKTWVDEAKAKIIAHLKNDTTSRIVCFIEDDGGYHQIRLSDESFDGLCVIKLLRGLK